MNSYKEYYTQKHCNPCKLPCHQYTECEATRYCCPRLKPKYNCFDAVIDVFAGPVVPVHFHPYKEPAVSDVFAGHASRIYSHEYRKIHVNDVFAYVEPCV